MFVAFTKEVADHLLHRWYKFNGIVNIVIYYNIKTKS